MKIVPIDVNNIDFIRLDLSRHYIQIDCDFVCYIVLNPSGTIPVGGTDVCAFHVGAWQVDAWKFLTKDFAQIPGFSACLVWDRTLVTELSKAPQVAESDIDTANSISSLKGQPVNITGFSLAEGESLKVSTLPDEFVNVKTIRGSSVSVYQNLYSVQVGKHFTVSDIIKEVMHEDSTYNNGNGQIILACSLLASNDYYVYDSTYDDTENSKAVTNLRDFCLSSSFSVGKFLWVGTDVAHPVNISCQFNNGVLIPYLKCLRINLVNDIVQDIFLKCYFVRNLYSSTKAEWVNTYGACEICLKNRDSDTELLFKI